MALICKNIDQITFRLIGNKLWSPNCCNQLRGKKKLTLRSPQFPPYEKKLLLAACEPIMKKKSAYPSSMTCDHVVSIQDTEAHPYITVLAEELKTNMDKSTFTVFYHVNPIDDLTYRAKRNALIKLGFRPEIYQNNVAELAFKSTKYEPLLKFFSRSAKTAVAFSDDGFDVKGLLKNDKSTPFMLLMFGIYQDRILRKSDLHKLVNLPSLPILHAQLVHILNSFGSSLTSTLDYHGKQLSHSLETYSTTDKPN